MNPRMSGAEPFFHQPTSERVERSGLRSLGLRIGNLLLVALVCLPAGLLGGAEGTTTDSVHRSVTHKPATSGHPVSTHSMVKTRGTRSARRSTTHRSAIQHSSAAHRSVTQANVQRPSRASAERQGPAHRSAYSSQHARSSARNRRKRLSTSQQRLARLHLEPDRVRVIQEALIHEGYLQGDATGEWDARTHDAMLRYQTIHGFPATGLPEAKSLLKLGLGPHPLPPGLDHATAGVVSPSAAGAAQGNFRTAPPTPPASPADPPS